MGNKIFLSFIVICASALFYSTFFFKKTLIGATSSPEGMPRIILLGIILTGIAILIRDWKKQLPCYFKELFKGQRLYVAISMPIYILIQAWIGFLLSTFIMLLVLFLLFTNKKINIKVVILNIILSTLLSVGIFIIFRHIFLIQLPMLGTYF